MASIAPHFSEDDLPPGGASEDLKVALFVDRVRGWTLDVAERLAASDPHSGFAVLSTVLSYLEMIGKFRDGFEEEQGWAGHYFVEGSKSVFGSEEIFEDAGEESPGAREKVFGRLYEKVRNGLYHEGITGGGWDVELDGSTDRAMLVSGAGETGALTINPEWFVRLLQDHFSRYALELMREGSEERGNFFKRFDARFALGRRPEPSPDGRGGGTAVPG